MAFVGNNSYSGGTFLNAGRASVAAGNALGSGTVTLNGGGVINTAPVTFANRFEHGPELAATLDRLFRTRPTGEWLSRFRGKVPSAPVNSVEEALRDEQVLARNMVIHLDHPAFGDIRLTGNPIKFPGMDEVYEPAPPLGADTDAILTGELGYTPERVARLRELGAI